MRDSDDFGASPDTERLEGELQSVVSAVNTYGISRPNEFGKVFLESAPMCELLA